MKHLLLALALASGGAFAANHEVKMLDNGPGGNMVFEPAFLKVAPGDTVTFKPVNTGHWVQSKAVPPGAAEFLSQADKPFSVKLEKEGVYVYTCPPHRMMNMSGIIQVGKPVNKAAAQAVATELDKRAMQNKGRLTKLMQKVK
ncbi:MAG: plastocyanin/azurin family copper-binding protein [Neisseria sp.]|uniref:plastocyanin/azurin family copper-binding protein n=1 Tax=Neisseria sp. TaxID=192066 RepID=UPI0026DDB504|nr:plastocyanin/azurin family copper-binding protein [Neisseria sp.]MDO4641938.1 plastocyanin/azurin family copper-binding protein [Neisseria sp.]